MADKFDRFTERARRVLTLAQEEAQRFNHNYIGTEHILLGLIREGDGIAARVLTNLGVQLPKVRAGVEFIIGRGEAMITGEIGLTPRAKKVLELAVDEARRLNHHYIGTEHLLLGLLREGAGVAAGVLESLGLRLERVRAQVIQELADGGAQSGARAARGSAAASQRLTTEEIARLSTPRGALLQVIPIVQRQAWGAMTITGVAIERYEHWSIVTWHLSAAQVAQPVHPQFDLRAEDNRGNQYPGNPGGFTGRPLPGGHYEADFSYRLDPALDPLARALTLTLTARRDDDAAAAPLGPWHFTVALPDLPAS